VLGNEVASAVGKKVKRSVGTLEGRLEFVGVGVRPAPIDKEGGVTIDGISVG
jgi:hypothetical protein